MSARLPRRKTLRHGQRNLPILDSGLPEGNRPARFFSRIAGEQAGKSLFRTATKQSISGIYTNPNRWGSWPCLAGELARREGTPRDPASQLAG